MKAYVNQTLAPIKFCFFIKPNAKGSFHTCVRLANSFWGGSYAPIFPLYKKLSDSFRKRFNAAEPTEDFYSNFLANYNPDIIYYEDGLDPEYVREVSGDRECIPVQTLVSEIEAANFTYGLSIVEILNEVIHTHFRFRRHDNLKISIPKFTSDNIFAEVVHGIPFHTIHEQILALGENSDFIDVQHIEPHQVNDSIAGFGYRQILHYEIRKEQAFEDHYEFLFFLEGNNLDDLLILWNLRAAGRKVLAVLHDQYPGGSVDEQIIKFYSGRPSQSLGPSVLKGTKLSESQLDDFLKYMGGVFQKNQLGFAPSLQSWIPRFGSSSQTASHDGVVASQLAVHTDFSVIEFELEEFIEIPTLSLDFSNIGYHLHYHYKVSLNLQFQDHLSEYPSVISGITRLEWSQITYSMDHKRFRLSEGEIIRFMRSDSSSYSFRVPMAFDYLKMLFKKSGIDISMSPGYHLTRQIYRNVDGELGAHLFSSKAAIQILSELEGGAEILHETLVGLVKKYKPSWFEKRPLQFLESLLKYKVLNPGTIVQCTVCLQRSFYELEELGSELRCKHCSSHFKPPLHNPKNTFKWAYRGIGPFSQNNKVGGLLTGFLTLKLFDRSVSLNRGHTALMNFDIKADNQDFEVDLFLQFKDKIAWQDVIETVFVECKTYKRFQQKDIDRMMFLGEKFPYAVLAFATLNDSLDVHEIELIRGLVEHFRKGYGSRPVNPVLVLTSAELFHKGHNPFDYYGEVHQAIKFGDYFGFLCDQSCNRYLEMQTWSDIQHQRWERIHRERNQKEWTSKS